MNREVTAFTSAPDYDGVERAMERQFELLALDEVFRPGMRVALKPNLVMKRAPERATTTHPAVVTAAVRALRRRGVQDIVLAESPGGPYTCAALEGIYAACGMADAACAADFRLNTDTSFDTLACGTFLRCASFPVIRPILEADAVLNLPKLKTHGMTILSGAVKNLFGCVPGLQKPELHYRYQQEDAFCEMLLDLAQAVRPAASIVDAVISMEGDGPSGGVPKRTGFLAGSRNPFALDAVLADRARLSPVTTVRISLAHGLTPPLEAIECLGDTVAEEAFVPPCTKSLDFLDRLPRPLRPAARCAVKYLAEARPEVTRRCVGCGKCAESCPAQIIRMENGRAAIDRKGCIRCFCCHEMCPAGAIRIRRLRIFSL